MVNSSKKSAEINGLVEPTTLVIFGITGDLAHRKLLPALYNLVRDNLLSKQSKIVGITRRGTTVQVLLDSIAQSLRASGSVCDKEVLASIGKMLEVHSMDLLDDTEYTKLHRRLDDIENEIGVCMNRLFYLAIPAQTFGPLVQRLGQGKLNKACQHGTGASRLLIEKPFGYDLVSAHELIDELSQHFSEQQLYRIDHYLAKETAQNILNFRFQNPIFQSIWNRKNIRQIVVSAAEEIGIEGRVVFYEQTGALRDVLQSHLLQLLALVTMDQPKTLAAKDIHAQKLQLLQRIQPIAPDKVVSQTVRGQYEGYRDEVQNPDSYTETYAAMRLAIDGDRWRGVPILLETGKALAEKSVGITITFSDHANLQQTNVLTFNLQPHEGITVQLLAKKPGFTNETEQVQMGFAYHDAFETAHVHPDPYERILMDALRGDKTLFATSDEVLASWRIIENVIHEWSKNGTGLQIYPKKSVELQSFLQELS